MPLLRWVSGGSQPDTRVATVTLGSTAAGSNGVQLTFQSGEARYVEPELVSAVSAKLVAQYPGCTVTTRGGA